MKNIVIIRSLLTIIVLQYFFLLKTPIAISADRRALDIILVVDNSGSVRVKDPKGLVRIAGKTFIEHCSSEYQMGIITFDSKGELLSCLTPISDETKEKLKNIIDRIKFDGQYTNINAGVEKALEEFRIRGRKNATKGIMLISDGEIDLPKSDGKGGSEVLLDLYELMLKYITDNIAIHSLLLLGNKKGSYQLMYNLANKTNGEFFWAFSPEELQDGLDAIYNKLNQIGGETEQAKILKKLTTFEEEYKGLRTEIKNEKYKKGHTLTMIIIYLLVLTIILGIALYLLSRRLKSFDKQTIPEEQRHSPEQINDTPISVWSEMFKRTKKLIDGLQELIPTANRLEKDVFQKYQADGQYLELVDKYIDAILYCDRITDNSGKIAAVKRRLESMLEAQGIERWIPDVGKPVPAQVETYPLETSEHPPGVVVEVISPGFRSKKDGAVLKPPKITIAVSSQGEREILSKIEEEQQWTKLP